MTLILGMMCADGLIIAAETEESAGITAKRNVDKLARVEHKNWIVIIGGAGDSAIVENAMRRIDQGLQGEEALTADKLGNLIDRVLAVVHRRYIDPDPKCDGVALIIGAVCGEELFLISTNKRTHQFHKTYAYAGIGADLAIYYSEGLYDFERTWEEATKIVAFTLYEVKGASQFCGGESQMYVLNKTRPRWRLLVGDAIAEIEQYARVALPFEWIAETLKNFDIGMHPWKTEQFCFDDYEQEEDEDDDQ